MDDDKNLDHRRKWNKDEYEKSARERIIKEIEAEHGIKSKQAVEEDAVSLVPLRARDYIVDISTELGKTKVVTKNTPLANLGGFYCNACDCIVRDSLNFLDHINGRKHQKALGMSMKIPKSTLSEVKSRLQKLKDRKGEITKEYSWEERMKDLDVADRKKRLQSKERRRQKLAEKSNREKNTMLQFADQDVSQTMGFASFSSSKK